MKRFYLFVALSILAVSANAHAENVLYANDFLSTADTKDLEQLGGSWSDRGPYLSTALYGAPVGGSAMAIKTIKSLPNRYFIQTRFMPESPTANPFQPNPQVLNQTSIYLVFNFRDAQNYKILTIKPARYGASNAAANVVRRCAAGEVRQGRWIWLPGEFDCLSGVGRQVPGFSGSTSMVYAPDASSRHLSVKVDDNKAHVFIDGQYKGTFQYGHLLRAKGFGFLVQGPDGVASARFDYLNIVE